jgi:hypothetical protein
MVKTRKSRTSLRRRKQYGGASRILKIRIPLKFEFSDEDVLESRLTEPPLNTNINVEGDLDDAKTLYSYPNVNAAIAKIKELHLAKDMIETVFTDAKDESGNPMFGDIIDAKWNDDYSITVRVPSELPISTVQVYLDDYDYRSLPSTYKGWVIEYMPRRFLGETLAGFDIVNAANDATQILVEEESNVGAEAAGGGGGLAGGRRKSKSKRKSRRVTRKKRRGGRR